MSILNEIKPSGIKGLYKVEVRVEGQWVSMALASKHTIIAITDLLDKRSNIDVEERYKNDTKRTS